MHIFYSDRFSQENYLSMNFYKKMYSINYKDITTDTVQVGIYFRHISPPLN